MAYKNGSYYCDSCGVKKGFDDGWKLGNSAATCPKCQLETKVLKEQEKELKRRKNEYKRSHKDKDFTGGSSSFSDLDGWSKFLVIMKWIFSYVWGGPYLIIQGLRTRDKFWLFTGIESTIVLIFAAVTMQLIPNLTESTEPLHIFLTYLIGGLLLINIIA